MYYPGLSIYECSDAKICILFAVWSSPIQRSFYEYSDATKCTLFSVWSSPLHRSFYEKLRAGQEDDLDGAELAEEVDEESGPKALTVMQLARVLKPYFWPK